MKKIFSLFGISLVFAIQSYSQIPATVKEAAFEYWDYSPTQVYGVVRLTSTTQRSHVKIVKVDPTTVRIQGFSANGQPGNTTIVYFAGGKISQMTETNRWGRTYEIAKFTSAGIGEFIVTRSNTGSNSYLPAKAVRDTYKKGLLTESRYISFDGKPIVNRNGVAVFRYSRYIDGNRYSKLKEISYYDENDRPVISRGMDCHKIVYDYDTNGNLVTTTYLGLENEPLTNRFGGYRSRSTYDTSDRILSSTTIGLDDKPVNNAYGIAATVWEYKNGLAVRATRYDALGNVTRTAATSDGAAIITYDYDANGYESSRSFFDERNLPINSTSGYGRVSYQYSPSGMLLKVAYFDRSGAAAADRDGIHRYEYIKDDKGREIQVAYFDKAGAPMKDGNDQVFIEKSRYDEEGRRVGVSYWQTPDIKMARWDGSHETVYTFNRDGQITELIYYDQNGKLFVAQSGYSRLVNTYDAAARWIERRIFNGQSPISLTAGFAKGFHVVKYSYDSQGRVSELRYYDTADKPVNANIKFDNKEIISFHRIEFIYKGNRIVEQRLFAVNSTVAGMIIDCLKNDYVHISGITIGHKNQ